MAKLKAVKTELMRRRHLPIPEQGRWLASVLRGHYNYYAVPDNSEALRGFRHRVMRHCQTRPGPDLRHLRLNLLDDGYLLLLE